MESHLTYSYNMWSCMLLMWCVLWRMFKMCWIGFFILTAGTMIISVLSNIITCCPMKVRSYFRGTYCLSLKDWRVRHARNQHEVGSKQNFTLWYWGCRWYVPLNVGPLSPEYMALCYKRQECSYDWLFVYV